MQTIARLILTVAAVAVVAVVSTAFSQDMSSVVNTRHNLNTADVWGVVIPNNQVCLPCHIPHNAMKDGDDSYILWNHELTTATFDMYGPYYMDRGDRDPQSPALGGPSRLCLSCHDGSIAIDSYGGTTGSVQIPPWRPTNLGIDLRDDHPIGIQYPADETEGYHNASTLTDVKLVDWGGNTNRLECTSCHDPHNNSLGSFLRHTLDGSAICLKCHDK